MSLYLDNAATTKIHKDVVDAMINSFEYYGNSEAKYYDVAEKAKELILWSRTTISRLLDGQFPKYNQLIPQEIQSYIDLYMDLELFFLFQL